MTAVGGQNQRKSSAATSSRDRSKPGQADWVLTLGSSDRALAGAGGDQTEAGAEKLQGVGEAACAAQPLPPALHDELRRARGQRRSFDNGKGRRFVGMAKHRKAGHAVAVVDRIVPPLAADHVAAVEAEQLVQL